MPSGYRAIPEAPHAKPNRHSLSDIHASVLYVRPVRYTSLDWFVERTPLDKVSAVPTAEAARPRLNATAYRTEET